MDEFADDALELELDLSFLAQEPVVGFGCYEVHVGLAGDFLESGLFGAQLECLVDLHHF